MPEEEKVIRVIGFLSEQDRENNENGQPLGEVTSMAAFETLTLQSTEFFMKFVDHSGNDLDWNGAVRYFDPSLPSWFFTELKDGDFSF